MRGELAAEDLTDAAVVYARIAMDLCNQTREAVVPLGAHPDRQIAASVARAPVSAEPRRT